ncbi:SEL1-like repeat protein [Candidatus Francisella endociliophora]|uniref:SEL1-like repeat protein n=1 Tax=Candidatus Francisella endociliophora TaxID=653937 RepID=UPI0006938482|nr:SEL1-like repeat protein [Francisella sp. FSC1006]
MKKTLLITSLLAISAYSFADIKECLLYAAQDNNDKKIEYCTPYLKDKDNPEVTGILAGAYLAKKDYKTALEYDLWMTSFYEKNGLPTNKNTYEGYVGILGAIGNIYYFGQAGKADKTKGLEYITKAANLGNDFAQYQLGTFYVVDESDPSQNITKAYEWFKISDINKNQESKSDNYTNQLMQFAKDKPMSYCIAMGEQLVAQAYINGYAGLSKDTSKAKKYLNDAIALYKDNEPTKENLQYCPEGADKLNLDSAKKQLDSL